MDHARQWRQEPSGQELFHIHSTSARFDTGETTAGPERSSLDSDDTVTPLRFCGRVGIALEAAGRKRRGCDRETGRAEFQTPKVLALTRIGPLTGNSRNRVIRWHKTKNLQERHKRLRLGPRKPGLRVVWVARVDIDEIPRQKKASFLCSGCSVSQNLELHEDKSGPRRIG